MSEAIRVRRPEFELGPEVPRYWVGGDPFRTHVHNALSSVFPDGEAFFVRSVLHYRDEIDDERLLAEIRAFAGQEGQHSHQHDLHVSMMVAQGYDWIAKANGVMRKVLKWVNRKFPVESLASTAALEHLTALLARKLMDDAERWTGDMDPRMARLWRWHALEEAEHKAVAYDVFQRVSGSYGQRVFAQLVFSTAGLAFETWVRTAYLLHKDGLLWRPRIWMGGMRWLFGRGGLLRGQGAEYMRWFRRDFHPNDLDDSTRIEEWRERIAV